VERVALEAVPCALAVRCAALVPRMLRVGDTRGTRADWRETPGHSTGLAGSAQALAPRG
jgi:hypothetical protein